jgi:hypothetical protein
VEANNQMFMAEKYFGDDSLNLALNGEANYPVFSRSWMIINGQMLLTLHIITPA